MFLCRGIPARQYDPAQQQPRSLATRKTKDAGLRNII
jgi:hypothetical protein